MYEILIIDSFFLYFNLGEIIRIDKSDSRFTKVNYLVPSKLLNVPI